MAKRKVNKEVKVAQVLPNPDAHREPIVEFCEGCSKVYEEKGVCMVYENPAVATRAGGCFFNMTEEAEAAKKVNPLKASKKKSRRK